MNEKQIVNLTDLSCAAAPPDLKNERRYMSRIGFGIFLLAAVTLAGQYGAAAGARALAPEMLENAWGIFLVSLLPIYLLAFPAGWLVMRSMPTYRPEPRKLTFLQWFQCFLVCLPMLYIGNAVSTGLAELFSDLRGSAPANALEEIISTAGILPTFIFAVVAAPIMEELVFRRLLADRLRRYGDGVAVLFSGLIFGLYHGNFYQFFYAAALGCFFAWVYCRTGRLRYTIFMHMTVNFLGSVVSLLVQGAAGEALTLSQGLADSGGFRDMIEYLSSLEPMEFLRLAGQQAVLNIYSIFMLGGSAAGIILAVANRKKIRFASGPVTLPKGRAASVTVWNWGMILALAILTAILVFNTFFV